MADYPLLLELKDRLCVVVGGGPVGRGRAAGLLAAGARVRLIEPHAHASRELPSGIDWVARTYRDGDLEGAVLVVAATGDDRLDRRIADEARRRGALVNRPGKPDQGDFKLPAALRRGNLLVTVSTAGGSPVLAALLKERLGEWLPPHWAKVLEIFAALRSTYRTPDGSHGLGRPAAERLLQNGLAELVAAADRAAVDRLLLDVLGPGHSLHELAVELTPEPT